MSNTSNEREQAKIELHLSEFEMEQMSDMQKSMLKEDLDSLEPLLQDQFSIDGIYAFNCGDKVELNVFLRNALNEDVLINVAPLRLLDEHNEVLAQDFVDFSEAGIIPSFKGKSHKIYIDKKNIFHENLNEKKWRIVFSKDIQLNRVISSVEFDELPEDLEFTFKSDLKEFLKSLPPLRYNDVAVNLFKLNQLSSDKLSLIIVIRNGVQEDVRLAKLPVALKDKNGNFVAGGIFDLSELIVKANKAKVYRLVLEKDFVVDEKADFSKCVVEFGGK